MLSVSAVARRLRVCPDTVRDLADKGRLPDVRLRPNGWRRFTPEAVEAFAREIGLHKIGERPSGAAGLS